MHLSLLFLLKFTFTVGRKHGHGHLLQTCSKSRPWCTVSVGKELFLVLCLSKWRGPGATRECYFYINKCSFVLSLPHDSFRNGSEFRPKPCHLTVLNTKQIFTANAEYLSLMSGVAGTERQVIYTSICWLPRNVVAMCWYWNSHSSNCLSKSFFLTSLGGFPSPAQGAIATFGREDQSEA